MARSGIKIDLKGFEKMLEQVERAEGNVNQVARKAVIESAKIVEKELKSACNDARVQPSVSNEITTEIEASGNQYSAKVGWKLGAYDPQNLSAGYKAVFLNYGTGKRRTQTDKQHVPIAGQWRTLGSNRGSIAPLGFIGKAKKSAKPKCTKVQKQIINEALEELK